MAQNRFVIVPQGQTDPWGSCLRLLKTLRMDPTGRFGAENSNKNLMRPLDNRDSTYEFVVTRDSPVLRKICASPKNWYLRHEIPYIWKDCEVIGAPVLLVELLRRCTSMVSGVGLASMQTCSRKHNWHIR